VKSVFRQCLNVCRVLDSRIPVGSLLQNVSAAKLKARLLKTVNLGRAAAAAAAAAAACFTRVTAVHKNQICVCVCVCVIVITFAAA